MAIEPDIVKPDIRELFERQIIASDASFLEHVDFHFGAEIHMAHPRIAGTLISRSGLSIGVVLPRIPEFLDFDTAGIPP